MINTKTYYKNGYECIDELCECGGTIISTKWNENRVLGLITLSRQWFCDKCNKEKKNLREIKRYDTGSKYGM